MGLWLSRFYIISESRRLWKVWGQKNRQSGILKVLASPILITNDTNITLGPSTWLSLDKKFKKYRILDWSQTPETSFLGDLSMPLTSIVKLHQSNLVH